MFNNRHRLICFRLKGHEAWLRREDGKAAAQREIHQCPLARRSWRTDRQAGGTAAPRRLYPRGAGTRSRTPRERARQDWIKGDYRGCLWKRRRLRELLVSSRPFEAIGCINRRPQKRPFPLPLELPARWPRLGRSGSAAHRKVNRDSGRFSPQVRESASRPK